MVAPSHDPEDLILDRRPILEELAVAHAHDDVAPSDQLAIPLPVALDRRRPGMPLHAVEFKDQAFADEEVDATDSRDHDLAPAPDASRPQSEPSERLQPGFCCGIERSENATPPRRPLQGGHHPFHRHQPELSHGVGDHDRVAPGQALDRAPEGFVDGVDEAVASTLVRPVDADAGASSNGVSSCRSHMQQAVFKRPRTVESQRGDAADHCPGPHGSHQVGMRRRHRVPAPTDPAKRSVSSRAPDGRR